MSKYSGSNFQLPVGGYLPNSGDVSKGLSSAGNEASQLWGISQPTAQKNKQGQITGYSWNPLALQKQLGAYQSDVNQGTAQIDAYTPFAMQAADTAAGIGMTTADMASGAVPGLFNLGALTSGMAPGMYSSGMGLVGQGQDAINAGMSQMPGMQDYASQALAQGFDPQNALFNRNAQQMRDFMGATAATSGLSGSAAGAGLENQGMENFLLDWQNTQLAREQSGAGTAGSIYQTIAGLPSAGESLYNLGLSGIGTGANLASTGANLDSTGLALGQGASQLADTSAGLPIQMAENIATGKLGLQDALSQAKTNMYNQRTGGFNAENQYLSTADNFIKTAIGAMQQNLGASQTGLNDSLAFASLPLQMMGK